MKIVEISAIERISEMLPLLEEHANELATHRALMVVNPDIEKYKHFEDAGCLVSLGLFDDEGNLSGYSLTFLVKNMHYSDLQMAQNDVLFIRKGLRKGSWGVKLIKETEEACKKKLMGKPFLMLWHGKPNTAFSELMPKLEYGVQDILFSKVLGT